MAWTTTTVRSSGFAVTAAVWNAELVNNMKHLTEVAYAEITSDVIPTGTTEATATAVVSAGARTYENVPHMIEFACPSARAPTSAAATILHFSLYDSTTAIAEIGQITNPVSGQSTRQVVYATHRITPTAASHTYNVKAWINTGTGALIVAGTGTGGAFCPTYIRIFRVPV